MQLPCVVGNVLLTDTPFGALYRTKYPDATWGKYAEFFVLTHISLQLLVSSRARLFALQDAYIFVYPIFSPCEYTLSLFLSVPLSPSQFLHIPACLVPYDCGGVHLVMLSCFV